MFDLPISQLLQPLPIWQRLFSSPFAGFTIPLSLLYWVAQTPDNCTKPKTILVAVTWSLDNCCNSKTSYSSSWQAKTSLTKSHIKESWWPLTSSGSTMTRLRWMMWQWQPFQLLFHFSSIWYTISLQETPPPVSKMVFLLLPVSAKLKDSSPSSLDSLEQIL